MSLKGVFTVLVLVAAIAATVYMYQLGAPYSGDDFFGIGNRGPIFFDRPVNLRPTPPPGGVRPPPPPPTETPVPTATPPPGPPALVSITLEPTAIVSGERTQLTWSAENVIDCLASGVWSGQISVTEGRAGGSIPLSPSRSGVHSYSLTCRAMSGESIARTATVTVSGGTSAPPPPPSGGTPIPGEFAPPGTSGSVPPPPPPTFVPPPPPPPTPTPSPTPVTWPGGSLPPPPPPPPTQSAGSAYLTLYPSTASPKVGDTISLTLAVDTFGSPVVAVKALLEFDAAHFEVVSVDPAESVFPIEAERLVHPGEVTVTRGRLSPGFTGSNGTVVVINLKALSAGIGNIRILLDDEAGGGPSSVILDDGWGTDILSGTYGTDYNIAQ